MTKNMSSIKDFRTIGEWRAYLAKTNSRMHIDPKFKDSDPIPRVNPGGKRTETARPRILTWEGFRKIVSRPATNPFLNARRISQGLLAENKLSDFQKAHLKERIVPGGTQAGQLPAVLPSLPPQLDWGGAEQAAFNTATGGQSGGQDYGPRFGWNWITSVQDQDGSADCWDFAATALIESMARIEHCIWFKGSELQVRYGYDFANNQFTFGTFGGDGGPAGPLQYALDNGICDELCVPWSTNQNDTTPPQNCADFSGRSVRLSDISPNDLASEHSQAEVLIPANGSSENTNYQMEKAWLDLNGPFIFFIDSSALWPMSTPMWIPGNPPTLNVYDYNPQPQKVDLKHFVLVVGYDDAVGAWICKNSYGVTPPGNGYFFMEYGAAGSELGVHDALYGTNPDPWSKRRLHGGALVEGESGNSYMNFELITVPGDGTLQRYIRDNDQHPFLWTKAETIPSNDAVGVGWPAATETTYNRNLEVVYATTQQRLNHWWLNRSTGGWNDGGVFGPTNVIGAPGFIQSNYGQSSSPGNFEVVVLNSYQQLEHWFRNNSNPTPSWQKSATFGSGVAFSGAALVQSHYGTQGNFELVCVLSSGEMQHWFRNNDAAGFPWAPTTTFGSNIKSPPCMIEGMYGATSEYALGNFELCVASGGNLQHWYRDNVGDGQWHGPTTFGDGHETSVIALIESSFGFNLEVIAGRDDGKVQHYWRDSSSLEWHAGEFIG